VVGTPITTEIDDELDTTRGMGTFKERSEKRLSVLGRNLGQWLKNKKTPMHHWMRNS
jgi:hypothetical protein